MELRQIDRRVEIIFEYPPEPPGSTREIQTDFRPDKRILATRSKNAPAEDAGSR
jgi:hypothetical protein